MQFGVLGPLQVAAEDSSTPQAVSAPRLRTVLAVLLWRANQPVPVDELADLVWDGAPPGGARETLRGLVMRLRRQLGQETAARILTRAPGYVIEVSVDEVDANRFEALTRQAGDAVHAGLWTVAERAAAGALGLWRSTPLADVPSQRLRDQWVPVLEQLHVQALGCRVEAELHEGRHAQLIPQLRELTALHPLREDFHGQLMRALALSGQRAEALAAYQEARRTLAAELGINPCPELRHLHQRVLAGDASLTALPEAAEVGQDDPAQPVQPSAKLQELHERVPAGELEPAAATPPRTETPPQLVVPRQLPAAAWHFTGRNSELGMLSRLVDATGPPGGTVVISAIDGMAGIGKTALAVQAAHRLAGRFPDGQLFLDLHGYTQGHPPRTAAAALDFLLLSLGVPPERIPADGERASALYRQCLAGTRTLIVLDNAASEAQVRPLLPGGGSCLVLVTSRRRLKGLDDAHLVSLDLLSPPDAAALLCAVAGPGRIAPGDPLCSEVAGLCGYLPLALRIAGALLRHRPAWGLEQLAGQLRDQHRRVSALSDGERDLPAVFDLSYAGLEDQQRRLWRRLGLIPGPDLDACAAAALAETDPARAAGLLEDLVDHNLLGASAPGRYRLHDLLRAHARTLAASDPAPEREAALGRLMDYYQHTAGRADTLIAPFPRPDPAGPVPACAPAVPDADTGRAWLRAERPNLLAALRHATSRGWHERSILLTSGLATLLRDDGPWSEALALHTDAIAAAQAVADRAGEAAALTQRGMIRDLTSDHPGAIEDLAQATELYRQLGDPLGQANALTRLAAARGFVDDCLAAIGDLEQALALYRHVSDPLGQAGALARLGNIRRYTGDYPGAIPDLEQALRLYQQLGVRTGQATMLTSLANAQRLTGDFASAAKNLEEALRLNRRLDHRLGQANALSELGELRRITGDYQDAARCLKQSLQIYQDLGNSMGQANAQVWLGRVRQSEGDHASAAQLLEVAMDTFRSIGSRGSEAWALNHYAAAVAASGQHHRALTLYQQALTAHRELNRPDDEAVSLEGIAEHHLAHGDPARGTAHLRQALTIYQRLGMAPDTRRIQNRLSD